MGTPCSTEIFLFERFRIDQRGLFRREQADVLASVEIGSRALDVLGALLQRAGDLVSRDEIMVAAWPGTVVEDNNLTVQISALRRILDRDRAEGSCIQTVPGRGYRFIAPVTRFTGEASPVSELHSANDSGGSAAGNGQSRDPVLGRIGSTPPSAISQVRRRLWVGIVALVIGAPVLAAAITAANWRSLRSGDAHLAPRLSIVVLPFANLSDDREQQYFADGITDDLTNDLSRIAGMLVISRNTAFTYRDKAIDPRQIGRELAVRYVLEGSVRRSGKQVRVNVQLIDAETDVHLWADRFDREMSDLFALQSEITDRIGIALDAEVTSAEAARPSEHPDALEYILRGRAALSKPSSPDNYAQAIPLYERALELDPNSVAAKAWLATALVNRMFDVMADSPAADQAVAASPRSPLAHFAKGMALRARGRDAEAIPEYEAVLAFNPNWVAAITSLGWSKFMTGSLEEAIPIQERAMRLSPRDPAIDAWYWRIGIVHLLQSRTDEAILWFEKARSANPARPSPHAYLASAYALKGEADRATSELAEARRLAHGNLYASITSLKAVIPAAPKMRALFEATYLAGLRKAGMSEE